MTLPPRVAETLVRFGVSASVRAGLDDLCRSLGPGVADALAEICEEDGIAPPSLEPIHLERIRPRLGARYLAQHHAGWLEGRPSPAFWRDRSLEGGATGLAIPLGNLEAPEGDRWIERVATAIRRATGPDQPSPRGILLMSRNAHFGNRPGVFSIDLVPTSLDDALALNGSTGQQHTLPGSIGEASGTTASDPAEALLWEVQPNVYKPTAERNRNAGAVFRRHRNWHLEVAIAALAWLDESGYRTFVLRGDRLQATHEVNAAKPVTAGIVAHHERTLAAAAAALGKELVDLPSDAPEPDLLRVANVALGKEIRRDGVAACVREARSRERSGP